MGGVLKKYGAMRHEKETLTIELDLFRSRVSANEIFIRNSFIWNSKNSEQMIAF